MKPDSNGNVLPLFPKPWVRAGRLGKYNIKPLASPAELLDVSLAMHIDALAYIDAIVARQCYLYVIRNPHEPTPVAMFEVYRKRTRKGMHISIGEFKGPGNQETHFLFWYGAFMWLQAPRISPYWQDANKLA